jgi:hypothetical protein
MQENYEVVSRELRKDAKHEETIKALRQEHDEERNAMRAAHARECSAIRTQSEREMLERDGRSEAEEAPRGVARPQSAD